MQIIKFEFNERETGEIVTWRKKLRRIMNTEPKYQSDPKLMATSVMRTSKRMNKWR